MDVTFFQGRISLILMTQFDPDGSEAKALEERLVIHHGTKKPAGTVEDLAKHFECDPSGLIMVGDRYFTDIVYGNNVCLLTIRPAPLTLIGKPFVVREVRRFEEVVVRQSLRQKVEPKEHALFTSPHHFIKDSRLLVVSISLIQQKHLCKTLAWFQVSASFCPAHDFRRMKPCSS